MPSELRADPALRELLFADILAGCTAAGLAEWLREIGQDTRGSVDERRARIRANSKYLSMPAGDFPRQTENYLEQYATHDLNELCAKLGLATLGSKDALYRRIMREVHYREGWLSRLAPESRAAPTADHVMPFLGWFPLRVKGDLEKDFYPVIHDELAEVFPGSVYDQLPIAHGSTLRVDFHVGDPQGDGVGIEVKMPKNNADIQRMLGQLDQYERRYGENLLLFVLQDLLKPELVHFAQDTLKSKRVRSVWR
jgi:hypothetical protein